MNPANQGSISDAAPALPVKRKRGRPRKEQTLNHVETVPLPAGFEGVSRNQPHRADAVDDLNDPIVGQEVTGVVEAAFDAGYLLTVRIGNSNINLRGVVFKPGHYVPVSPGNDVAPNVQMIRRNEIHVPTVNQTEVHGTNQMHESVSQTPNPPVSKGKYASPVATPSVFQADALQPVNPSNELSPANQFPSTASQGTDMTTFKGKDAKTVAPLAAALPLDGFTSKNQELRSSQLQTIRHVMQTNVPNENGRGTPEVKQQGQQAKPTELTDMTSKVVHNVSESLETHSENGNMTAYKYSVEDYGVVSEQENRNVNKSVSIKPPQSTQYNLHNHSAVLSRSEDKSHGRMTELLQAVQENILKNYAPQDE